MRRARGLALEIETFFADQARRARAEFLAPRLTIRADLEIETKAAPTASALVPDADADLLIRIVLPHAEAMTLSASGLTAGLIGGQALQSPSAQLTRLLASSGDRIRHINTSTRSAVQRALDIAFENRFTDAQTADLIGNVVNETYAGRAQAIARTEMAIADQNAALETYRAAGLSTVLIHDGPECGWTHHNDPDKANGSRRTMAQAEAYPIAHPNCVRSFVPDIDVS